VLGSFRKRVALLALGVVAEAGCIPEPVDVTGKRCDPDQACGPGFQCLEGRCSVGAATQRPTNLVSNPGFEEGAQGWVTTSVVDDVRIGGAKVRRNSRNCRLSRFGWVRDLRRDPRTPWKLPQIRQVNPHRGGPCFLW
jgi:hypothetical protein